jgi:hypothetical protein
MVDAFTGDTGNLRQVMQDMQSERVDFVGMGDSNQLLGGTGWDHGFQYALFQRYPMYATGLLAAGENGGNGAGTGFGYSTAGPSSYTAGSMPSQIAQYQTNVFPSGGGFYGTVGGFAVGVAVGLDGTSLPSSNSLVFELHHGTFPSGTHTATIGVRNGIPNYDVITTQSVNATTGSYGMTHTDISLTANPSRTIPLEARWAIPGGADSVDMAWLYSRAYSPAATHGFSYSTLAGYGGQPTRAVANALNAATDASLSYYFSQLRRLQGSNKHVVLVINEGFNDRLDSAMSVGPSPAVSSSAAGYKDNVLAIVNRIKAIWQSNGWDVKELNWVFMPSHAISTPDDASLVAFRDAMSQLTAVVPQSVAIDLSKIATPEEMSANNWYLSGDTSFGHLSQAGYEVLSDRVIDTIAVPEPATAGVLAIGMIGCLLRRPRRQTVES